jgi:hypothetical protein
MLRLLPASAASSLPGDENYEREGQRDRHREPRRDRATVSVFSLDRCRRSVDDLGPRDRRRDH